MQVSAHVTRFAHVWVLYLLLVPVVAQDSLSTARHRLVDDLMRHRILSERGSDQLRKRIDYLHSTQGELAEGYVQQQVREQLSGAGNAFRTIQWYRYWGDSLNRTWPLENHAPPKRRRGHELEIAVEKIRHNGYYGPPPRPDLTADVLEWAMDDTAFAKELAGLEWQLGYVDPNLFTGSHSPEKLIEDLHGIALFDEWLAEDLRLELRCGRIYDVAELLLLTTRKTNDREWKERSRKEVVVRVNALVQAGFLNAREGEQLLDTRDPYSKPSDFEIAMASSPHLVLDCEERVWRPESYYPEYLPQLAGIVPELAPTDVKVVRRFPDQTLVNAAHRVHAVEVSFMNRGRRYAFRVYEGRGELEEVRSCGFFMLFHALNTLNKALCDAGSSYRLVKHEFTNDECGFSETQRMCLAFIDPARCDIWWPSEQRTRDVLNTFDVAKPYSRCDEIFRSKYCRDSIAVLVTELTSLGILRHLTTSQIDSATTQANATMPRAWADVLKHYPDVLSWPGGNRYAPMDEGDLQKHLMHISAISQGAVTISHIKEQWRIKRFGRDQEKRYCAELSFRVNNDVIVKLKGDAYMSLERLMEDRVMIQLNESCALLDIPGRFCTVEAAHNVPVLFLDRAQYDALKPKVLTQYFGNPWDIPTHRE